MKLGKSTNRTAPTVRHRTGKRVGKARPSGVRDLQPFPSRSWQHHHPSRSSLRDHPSSNSWAFSMPPPYMERADSHPHSHSSIDNVDNTLLLQRPPSTAPPSQRDPEAATGHTRSRTRSHPSGTWQHRKPWEPAHGRQGWPLCIWRRMLSHSIRNFGRPS